MAQWLGAGGAIRALDIPYNDHDIPSIINDIKDNRGKRTTFHDDDLESYDSEDFLPCSKRPRYDNCEHHRESPGPAWPSKHIFFVLREGTSTHEEAAHYGEGYGEETFEDEEPESEPEPVACFMERTGSSRTTLAPEPVAYFMERTSSGRTIISNDSILDSTHDCADFSAQDDKAAAQRVRRHLFNLHRDSKHGRILKSLIHPKHQSDFTLDNAALESIFSAADEIFFRGWLSQRVTWEWSTFTNPLNNNSNNNNNSRIIGTTALRTAKRGGYETLIVLSSPILTDNQYNRRLLISTFLHELIHSYLFICCGFKARHCGGHTDGFKEIASLIDNWAGKGTLHLCDMEADLRHFRDFRGAERSPAILDHKYHDNHHNQNRNYDDTEDKHVHHIYGDEEGTYSPTPGFSFNGRGVGTWSTGATRPTTTTHSDRLDAFNATVDLVPGF